MDTLIPLLLTPFVILPLLGIYYYQYRKFKRNTPYLLGSFLVMFLAIILAILDVALNAVPFSGSPLGLTGEMSVVFLTLFFYLHFQSLASIRPPLARFSVIMVLTTTYIAMQIPLYFGLIERSDPEAANYFIFSYTISMLQAAVTMYYAIRISYRNYIVSKSSATRNEFIAMVMIFLTFTGIPIEFILEYSGNAGTLFHTLITYIPSFLGLIGYLLFLINYFRNVEYLYSIPIQIHSILWYNTIGTPIYRKKIESDTNISEDLLSGAFSAISSVLEESLSEAATLSHIDLGYYNVFFGHIEDLGTLTLICDQGSAFFINAIERFTSTMDQDLKDLLAQEGRVPRELQQKMDLHLYSMFPFLQN